MLHPLVIGAAPIVTLMKRMKQTEEQTLLALANGIHRSDRNSFDELFRLLYRGLVHYAYGFTGDKSSACDLVQDAFVKLWQKRKSIDPELSVKAYLYRIVRNLSLNLIRDRSRESGSYDEELLSDADTKLFENTEMEGPDIELVRSWIEELPDRQREAFEMSRFEGLEHDEIARIMEISSRTVNNHIVSALRNLRLRHDDYRITNKKPSYG